MGCASVNLLYTLVKAGIDSKKSTSDPWRLTYREKLKTKHGKISIIPSLP